MTAVVLLWLRRTVLLLRQHSVLTLCYTIVLSRHEQSDEKAPGDVGNFGDNFKPADEAEYAALQVCTLCVMFIHTIHT
jgi:hypothetical protein